MSVYSVYDYSTQLYTYYEGVGAGGTHAAAPPKPMAAFAAGATPEGASWRLPFGAKKIGQGLLPRGRIASTGIHLGVGDLPSSVTTYAVIAALGYLAWRYWR